MTEQNKYQYNSWPLGKIPKELQRPEPELIKQKGYHWNDPRDIIDIFENKIAKFANCKHAILVDCCTNGIFLSLKYLQEIEELKKTDIIEIPKRTYVSVPMQIMALGNEVLYKDVEWQGLYQIGNTRVWDSAVRWTKDMYIGNDQLQVISFQIKKRLPIGKGGVVLTNDSKAAEWLKFASYDGRDLTSKYDSEEHIKCLGYHFYMTPEDAARGILLMDSIPEINDDSGNYTMYPDITQYRFFKKENNG